ncbi:hypothetical protein RJ639_007828 [Escallonia herrerae]|uniref:RING-type E3 ubiquitin transferase n=1 Tax=Escallonia herrerae TaxID=1293975 RepID=A0AA88W0J0_9ASTE|nr:hypothetical protein RJ639_007828 [Escallonia herrerae]
MCTELMKLVDRVGKIFPDIEAARPRCSSGIQALCLLNGGMEKAKLLIQYCSESSKLYLAITGNVVLARCEKSRNLLERSLSQIQNMVPVMLAAEISRIIIYLRGVTFSLDPFEEEAGRIIKSLLHRYASATDSLEDSAIEGIQIAASRLQITSPKALLMEKRSIKKLLDKLGDDERAKKQILVFLLNLLKKYGNSIFGEQMANVRPQHEDSSPSSFEHYYETDSHIERGPDEAQTDVFRRPIPIDEFKCPISSKLMYDPVVIASGLTFERIWIQKWFDEGHDTCPKTSRKLAHLSLTPNTTMRDLISKWSMMHGVTIPDPCMQSAAGHLWETSSTSIASLSSSMNDLCLPVDFSNVSLGSLDSSQSSDSSGVKIKDGIHFMPTQTADSHTFQSQASKHETKEFLHKFDSLSWESQSKLVEDVKIQLQNGDQAYHVVLFEKFQEPLIKFLAHAHDMHDVKAQRDGWLLLLAILSDCRKNIPYLPDRTYDLLTSFLNLEGTEEVLAIMEVLSRHRSCRSKIAASGALIPILKILETRTKELEEPAIKILYNLSMNNDIRSLIVSSDFIAKLVPFFEDAKLARYCIVILKNLCNYEDAKISVAETHGCIASITKLLEDDNPEDQENAVAVLLSLCSQRDQYCQLVMDEGVVPALVSISVNGNDMGKASAMELLRLLRDIEYNDVQESPGSDLDFSRDSISYVEKEKKSRSKASGLFRKISIFTKPSYSPSKRQK